MTQTITRLFPDAASAAGALAKLKGHGFRDEHIHTVAPSGGAAESIAPQIMKGRILKSHAHVYAKGVAKGGTLVTVHAPFGTARRAMDALDSHGPVDSGVAEPVYSGPAWDSAAPISSAMQMPVHAKGAAPFSDIIGMKPLASSGYSLFGSLGWRALSRSGSSFSSKIGMPLLSKKAAPFSALFGLPTLRR